MLKTNLLGSHLQAPKRNKMIQNELIISKLHRLLRPIEDFARTGLDIVSFILQFGA
jgi:hypothetical protein